MKKTNQIPDEATKFALGMILSGVSLLSFGLPNIVVANPHTTVLPKNTPDAFATRVEPEGANSVVNSFRIPHGCNGRAIRAMSIVFPNGPSVAKRMDTRAEVVLADHIEGNPIMMPRPQYKAEMCFGKLNQLTARLLPSSIVDKR